MPARTSTTRSTRTSTAVPSRKSSQQTLNGRASTTSRISTPYLEVPAESPDNDLRTRVCAVFGDAQRNTAGHRKLVINLRKIQESCCYEPSSLGKKGKLIDAEELDEAQFNDEFIRCVLRCMPVKKSESTGERMVRFIGLFLKHASEKDNELNPDDGEESGLLVETPSTRLITQLMNTILPLMTAKEKFVRFRSTQLVAHVINSLEAIDDEIFQLLRHGLLKRIHDKEAMVRVQAVLGLGRLAGNEAEGEAEDSEDEESAGLLDKLLEVLQNDPSADVRRSLLVNLPILPNTLPSCWNEPEIRTRQREELCTLGFYLRWATSGTFRFPCEKKLLRWGLRDRDENVRKAAGKLFRERWIEDCAGTAALPEPGADGAEAEPKGPSFEGLLELLERIDVVNSGVENGVALEAMKGFWEGRPDYRDEVTFDDHFWDTLSAESVFMARSFNDFCRNEGNGKFEALIEEKMPEVTKLAFYLSRYIEVLVEALKRVATQEYADDVEEEDTVEQEFIVEQLLHIAGTLDYSDEVGRRKMFTLLRQSLSIPDIPEEVTKLTVQVLRGICAPDSAGEREFCSVVLEAVADVHDTIMDEPAADEDADESFHSAKSAVSSESTPTKSKSSKAPASEAEAQEKAIREIMVNMKCLHIVQCMLENIEGELQKNVDLVAMLNNLVVPAVRSQEAPIRERGLVCMGLCSLLDNALAEENIPLFVHFFSKGHSALQITAIQILTDILNQYGAKLLDSHPEIISKVFLKGLKSGAKAPEVQAAATVAIAKLLLGRVISDASPAIDDLLRTLILLYFDPSTVQNQGVRQTLSYFLPVYSFSRKENQDRVRKVSIEVLRRLFEVQETFDEDAEAEAEMVSLTTVGRTSYRLDGSPKMLRPGNQLTLEAEAKKAVAGDVHLELARDILNRMWTPGCNQQEKKMLAPLLAKLYISPTSDETLIREVYADISEAVDDKKLALDATGRNSVYKIHVSLGKIVNSLNENGKEKSRAVRKSSVTPSALNDEVDEGEDDQTALATAQEDVEPEDEATVLGAKDVKARRQTSDSLVEELLSDGDDVEMSGL